MCVYILVAINYSMLTWIFNEEFLCVVALQISSVATGTGTAGYCTEDFY